MLPYAVSFLLSIQPRFYQTARGLSGIIDDGNNECILAGAERDLLIFFITLFAGYKSTLLSLEERVSEVFEIDMPKITEGLS